MAELTPEEREEKLKKAREMMQQKKDFIMRKPWDGDVLWDRLSPQEKQEVLTTYKITEIAFFTTCEESSLPNLEYCNTLYICDCKIMDLPKLIEVDELIMDVGKMPRFDKLKKCKKIFVRAPEQGEIVFTLQEFRENEEQLRACKTMAEVRAIRNRLDKELGIEKSINEGMQS